MNAQHHNTKLQFPTGPVWERAVAETNWLIFRLTLKDDGSAKLGKVPCGKNGRTTDKKVAACMTFQQATGLAEKMNAKKGVATGAPNSYGVGYVARAGSALVSVDMDDFVGPDGIHPLGSALLKHTYGEFSPSGNGLRILLERQQGDDMFREIRLYAEKKGEDVDNIEGKGLGFFGTDKRFFTVTGNHCSDTTEVRAVPQARHLIERVQRKYVRSDHDKGGAKKPKRSPQPDPVLDGIVVPEGMQGLTTDNALTAGTEEHWITHWAEEDAKVALAEALSWVKLEVVNTPEGPKVDRDLWLTINMSCHAASGGADWGYELCDEWNQQWPSYRPDKNRSDWHGFNPTGDVKPATVFYHAQKAGFDSVGWQLEYTRGKNSSPVEGGNGSQSPSLPPKGPSGGQGSTVGAGPLTGVTQDDFALWFAGTYHSNFRYDHSFGQWRMAEGGIWVQDEYQVAQRVLGEGVRATRKNPKIAMPQRDRNKLGAAGFANGALSISKVMEEFSTTAKNYDNDPWALGTPDGWVDLRTCMAMPPSPSKMLSKRTSVTPAQGTPALWLKFLTEATAGDPAFLRYIQKLWGYCLTGDVREEKFWFLEGSGGNGKGTMVDVVSHIMDGVGGYAVHTASRTFLLGRFEDHLTELAFLKGARVVFGSEVPDNAEWNVQRIKELTGNEGKINARYMRQDPFNFKFSGKLMFVGNDRPKLSRVDEAIKRRIVVLPFRVKPKNPDNQLKEKLREEYPQILQWMLDGLKMYLAEGLVPPPIVRQATEEYLNEQDHLRCFLSEAYDACEGSAETIKDLSDWYRKWLVAEGLTATGVPTPKALRPMLETRGVQMVRRSNGWHVVGLKRRQDMGMN